VSEGSKGSKEVDRFGEESFRFRASADENMAADDRGIKIEVRERPDMVKCRNRGGSLG